MHQRQKILLNESEHFLRGIRIGASRTRELRRYEIQRMIHVLIEKGMAPTSLSAIKTPHIETLVAVWKKQSLALKTCCNRMGHIRTFFQYAFPKVIIPDNAALGIGCIQRATAKLYPSLESLTPLMEKIIHPLTRSLLDFQVYFGLTPTEAIRIDIESAIYDGYCAISRRVASHGKDRFIPIITPQQKHIIATRQTLMETIGRGMRKINESQIRTFYRVDCQLHGLPDLVYRYYYVMRRSQQLAPTHSRRAIIQQVQSECRMGRDTIGRYV